MYGDVIRSGCTDLHPALIPSDYAPPGSEPTGICQPVFGTFGTHKDGKLTTYFDQTQRRL